jgi:hypothetical protein
MAKAKATKAQLIKILADPETESIQDAARKIGCSFQALYARINRNPEILEDARQAVRELVKSELGPIYRAQIRKAKQGDTAAARLIFEAIGEIGKAPTGREDDPIHYIVDYPNANNKNT